jgi:aminodeoxyfutalosine synthase
MAGSEEQNPSLSTEQICELIYAVNRVPVERDSVYNEIKIYEALENAE